MKKKLSIIIILLLIIIFLLFLLIERKEKKHDIILPSEIPIKKELEEKKIEEKKEIENKEDENKNEVKTSLPQKESIKNGKISFDSSFPKEKTEDISEFLKNFFEKYYKALEELKYDDDISDMFLSKEQAYIYKTALDLLITNRKNSEFDLTINNPQYELKAKKFKVNADKISFTVLENCSYNFSFIKNYTSSVYNIENVFSLTKVDGKYKIENYRKVQDFYVLITDVYKKSDDFENALEKIKSKYLVTFENENKKIAEMKKNYLNNNYQKLKCDHEYNREKAAEYALTWVGRRNNKWHTYSANCVNFVSQVMNAGGIPMDHYGKEQWKWYSTTKNTKNTASGFVYSWTYVPSIVSYFKNNTGYGLCGKYNENIYLGEKGDVIVFGSTGPTRHVVTVIDQIKNEKGEVVDLLLNSNTVDLEYFPLSAYAYPYKVLMKVYGWNN